MSPNSRLLYCLSVNFFKRLSSKPPAKERNPSSRENIPNKKMAMPAQIRRIFWLWIKA
jgi:hypothetical protein